MKKTNFTLPKWVNGLMLIAAMVFTTFYTSQLNAQCVLSTEDLVAISLSETNCDATLTPEIFLTDDGAACSNATSYEFEVRSANGSVVLIPRTSNAVLDYTFIGGPYMVIIWALNGTTVVNTGMSAFTVADKMPPVIDCPDYTVEISCWQQDVYLPTAYDNCTDDVTLTKIKEVIKDNNCNQGWDADVFRIVDRWYMATDDSGNNSDTCHVVLQVNRLSDYEFYTMIRFPEDFIKTEGTAISCPDADYYKDANGDYDPFKTGWPYIIYPDENPTLYEQSVQDYQDTVLLKNDCVLACNLASTYLDVNINTCPECVEKTVRFWTVVESSCQYPERFRTGIQTIEVIDTIPPVIVPLPDVTVTTNNVDCQARYTFPTPVITDQCCNCQSYTISVTSASGDPVMFADTTETQGTVKRDLPLGVNTVMYTAYDKCGNSSFITFKVEVVDATPPVAICQQNTTVSLTYDGEAILYPSNVNSGSYDDCELTTMKIRRMNNTCDGYSEEDDSDKWFDYVHFCCDDIARNDITVVMRVWDAGNNYNDCMVQVNVQDKLPPQITCPPSLCVECDYPFDLENMSDYFGTVVEGEDNVETHYSTNPYWYFYNTSYAYCDDDEVTSFNDGWAHDNCGLDITETYVDYRTQCGNGNVVRTFTASDPVGSVNCTQTIHFYNPEPFDEDDIEWPADVSLEGCSDESNYGPEVTGWPILNEDACDLVASNYDDLVYHFNDDEFDAEGVCFKVIRRWTVMDWCQKYTEGPKKGQYVTWYWDQVIMISETNDPYFTSTCEDTETCTYDSECESGYIELTMSAADDCTNASNLKWRYKIDYDNDGSFDIDSKNFSDPIISGETANASGDYPVGTHRIVWQVWDQCGNSATCDKEFTIKNCKKPTPICIDHVVVEMMPVDTDNNGVADWAMIQVGPKLVEHCCAKSYHPCGYDLTYSFSSDPDDTLRTYTCDSIGLRSVQMWVTAHLPDGTTTSDYCVTQIDFQDNNNVCPETTNPLVNISGSIVTPTEIPIPNTTITVQGSELGPQTTDNDGTFSFSVEENRNYELTPSKDGDDVDGISTLDLVMIQKHILGLKKLTDPYELLAANANLDTKVSASDILPLRKLILGQGSELDKSWIFVPKDYDMEGEDPNAETIPTGSYISPTGDMTVNFYGIKVGDVNQSLIEPRSAQTLDLAIDAAELQSGDFEIPVYADNFGTTEGFQFTVIFDANKMKFNGIESGALVNFDESNIGLSKLNNGEIAISWNKVTNLNLDANTALFTLKFISSNPVNLKDVLSITSSQIKKEAYNEELEVMDVNLNYRNAEGNVFALYQNTPNPFSDYTNINFNLPENSHALLTIMDLTGKVVYSREGDFTKGMNTVKIEKSDLNASGVLMYKLETSDNIDTKKMIMIK